MNTLTEVKERPILFSGPMVQAILEGRKTQTRRVVKLSGRGDCADLTGALPEIRVKYQFLRLPNGSEYGPVSCPYNCDRLWVKEAFWLEMDSEFSEWHGRTFHSSVTPGESEWCSVYYPATDSDPNKDPNKTWTSTRWEKKPSIFMPRFHSRITLDVINVRVERLQDISEEDAIAEGIQPFGSGEYTFNGGMHLSRTPVESFRALWDSINSKTCPWDSNPWVWVVTFKKLEVKA